MRLIYGATIAACAAIGLGVYAWGVDVSASGPGRAGVTYTDRTGAPIGSVYASDENHAAFVPLQRVSPWFVQSIVAAEDARFYSHGAIDMLALARAARDALIYGEARSGGSTIQMQLARLLWPTPSTLRGKLMQIAGAERIALRSTREAILQAYVNRIPMGGNVYGIEAASRIYLGVPANDLDLAQASLLAAIPNDPVRYSPYDHWHALRLRQRYVLDRLVATHMISRTVADRTAAEPIHLLAPQMAIGDAPHLLFWLYPQTSEKVARVRTTLDPSLQRFVAGQVAQVVGALADRHVSDAAALVVDNHTGEVLAYVGSPNYFSDRALGRNDGVQALRQPGSSLKPFTYELALERNVIRPTTILPDVPTTYSIPGGKLYEPVDYSSRFSGPVRVRYALANSLNVPAVRVLSALQVEPLLDRLHELGFAHLDRSPDYYGLGLTLGSGEVSLWELTRAYATMARSGSPAPLHATLDSIPEQAEMVGDRSSWQFVTDVLADAHARAKSFGVHSVLEMPFPAAVKTGTSSDFRDTWTVGFTRDYTVGVWVGNFDGSAMRDVSGVTGAGPLWNRIMLHLHEQREPDAFPPPAGMVRAPICAITGRRPDSSCPVVVTEWLAPRDFTTYWGPGSNVLGSEYDAWLAGQPRARANALRIVTPQDGNVYVFYQTADALARATQRLELRTIGAHGRVAWTVNGTHLATDSRGEAFWPLQIGDWTIRASSGHQHDAITVRVIPPPHGALAGFTITPR